MTGSTILSEISAARLVLEPYREEEENRIRPLNVSWHELVKDS